MRASSRAHRARLTLKALDATYQARAVPPGSARHWSWLFAATEARAPLLGIYALLAEWQALMDPATESSVAHLKLAWWGEEIQRLKRGSAVHPISSYLADLPRAAAVDFDPLLAAVATAATQIGGAPLERGTDLESQCRSLYGGPLALASLLAADVPDAAALGNCTQALAAGEYLAKALRDYRRESSAGRVPFAIDELLAAGIDNDDLAAAPPPAHLQSYLDRSRERACSYFESAGQALPPAQRGPQRHLLVLAALGRKHLDGRSPPGERRRFKDMLLAWTTARRAH
jgi:15-cis-phytoene synthase